MELFFRVFGGGPGEEEERIVKGDDVIVELDATLVDLYMGGTLKVRNYVFLWDLLSLTKICN